MRYDPYADLPALPKLTVRSEAFGDGDQLPLPQISAMLGTGGGDATPQLSWADAPEGTKSFAVTCLDPDAPTGSGFWHWAVFNIPATVTSLKEGAMVLDDPDMASFGESAKFLKNDGGVVGFVGAAPPAGHGNHRYMFVVHAVDTERLDIDASATPAFLGFNLFGRGIARGRIMGTFGR